VRLDNDASHKLSAVVAFRGRDLVVPKGIDCGETLVWGSAEELLAHHLHLASDAKAFWKDGFLLYTLWAMGDFCGIIPHEWRTKTLYPYTRTGFYQFLHDHGSQISPAVGSRRINVFRAYNQFAVTIIRMVGKAGINKAFAAIPYIQGDTIRDMQLCIETPYYSLRATLQEAYPQSDDRRRRSSRSKEELHRAAERRAVRVIVDNQNGMIGRPGIFVPRQYRQDADDELRAQEVFDIAMRRLGTDDRDAFFMQVVELVANTWLTKDARQAVEQLLSEQGYI